MDITGKTHQELQAVMDALDKVQAIIWFKPDGTIIEANSNFCDALGYRQDEIVGRHHRMFVDPEYARSDDYRKFWDRLARGDFVAGEFTRIAKDGSTIYIDASYNAIRDDNGQVSKVVKFASDNTERKNRNAAFESQIEAIGRSQAVIEFNLDGTILTANDNFLRTSGYALAEIQGRHHRMFVDAEDAESREYAEFWRKLARGEFISSEFRRIARDGRHFWIQASYNPILDPSGQPFKVLKFATDITERKENSLRLIQGVTEAAASILQEAEEIARTSGELSKRSEHQAATVEQTAAAMEQIAATINSNVKNAEEATSEARDARASAEKGGEVVEQAIAAMKKIEAGSQQVRKFIEVIDSIAFQTNLLALNAGVEAARAGDAGRGFAVVASEVRALAQRASESAKDINALIDSNGREVGEGARLVSETGKVLNDIMAGVTGVSERIESIFAASREQASGATEINQAVSSIDRATQENAAMSETSAAAAAILARNSNELQELLCQFDEDGQQGSNGDAAHAA